MIFRGEGVQYYCSRFDTEMLRARFGVYLGTPLSGHGYESVPADNRTLFDERPLVICPRTFVNHTAYALH